MLVLFHILLFSKGSPFDLDSRLVVISLSSCENPCRFYAWSDLYRGSASLELYRGSLLQIATKRLQKKFIYSSRKMNDYKVIYKPSKP
ncbi:hypothetical protein B296_00005689 [Ensete ventricosum]|uniref:Uncharacterized protein n=1 Tax=Ensete ventricosum TaxID=4639 RepID=A0A426XKP3_ENSVE|nr:hypothetical protein B296_00005689 [Ensete ventricosum]